MTKEQYTKRQEFFEALIEGKDLKTQTNQLTLEKVRTLLQICIDLADKMELEYVMFDHTDNETISNHASLFED